MKGGVMTPEAYELLQRGRRAIIKAGEENWTQGQMVDPGDKTMCALGRIQYVATHRPDRFLCIDERIHALHVYQELKDTVVDWDGYAIRFASMIMTINDQEGYAAVVAALDRLVEEYRSPWLPAPTLHGVAHSDRPVEATR